MMTGSGRNNILGTPLVLILVVAPFLYGTVMEFLDGAAVWKEAIFQQTTRREIEERAVSSAENDELPRLHRNSKHRTRSRPTAKLGDPIGTFNGFDLFYVEKELDTRIHCMGENFRPDTSLLYRSCEYTNFCFDLQRMEFVVFADALEPTLPDEWFSSTFRDHHSYIKDLEVIAKVKHSPASRDGAWYEHAREFQPTILKGPPPQSYYFLDVALIPYYRFHIGYRNPGHLGWQDLVPLYTLLETFGREEEDLLLVPLRSEVPEKYFREGEKDLMNKIGSKVMGMPSFSQYNPFWDDGDFIINITSPDHQKEAKSKFVCAKTGLTGHGQSGQHASHRYNPSTTKMGDDQDIVPHHHGGGGFFRRFRRFMLDNLGINDEDPEILASEPAQVLFAMNSSTGIPRGGIPLDILMEHLRPSFNESEVHMKATIMHKHSIEEQARILTRTKVLFMAAGGGTFPSIFLPEGAHLVIFYFKGFLDWDYWQNMGHISVHWIPCKDVFNPQYYPAFQHLLEGMLGKHRTNSSFGVDYSVANSTSLKSDEANQTSTKD